VWTLDDSALTALLARDQIDILVELSGHFADHRLNVFARRAAPVQVAFPHFPATTGVEQIDYLLTDIWTTPPGSESEYTEQIYRLPSGYIAFQLAETPPPVTPLPALANGYITFGLFQRPGKYHAQTWDAIAAVLCSLPTARLLCHYESAELDTPGSPAQRRVAEEGLDQPPQVRVGHRRHMLAQFGEHLLAVPRRGRKVVCLVDLPVVGALQLMHCQLHPVLVNRRQAAHLDVVVAIEGVHHLRHVVPHLRVDITRLVAERQRQVRLARLLLPDLLVQHKERGLDGLIGLQLVGELFHLGLRSGLYFHCRSRNRYRP
ncbi:MAG: hypothetical protein B7X34_02755, partial [Acidobacteriia bacterium 12-62-4]